MEDELDIDQLRSQLAAIKTEGVITSLAIVLMHSYAYPDLEELIERVAREEGFD